MRTSFTRFVMVPAVLLLLSLSGCGSGDSGGTSVSGDGTQQLALTAEDTAAAKAIADGIINFDATTSSQAKTVHLAVPPVAGEIKVFGKKEFVIPRSGTLSVSKTFTGLVDGAEGTLVFYNSFGKDIPTTPCVGTARQIKICEAARAIALALNPTSVEVILNGQTIIAPNQIPRTQGKALLPVTVNSSDQLQINLAGPKYSFIQLEVWSQPTAPVVLDPVAEFSFNPMAGSVPLAVAFDASSSSTPNGSITNYFWDFGDGSTDSGSVTPVHIYLTAGTYSITLTVTDSVGKTGTLAKQLVVNPPPQPFASFTYAVDSSTGALMLYVDGSSSSSPNGFIVDYVWDWGDGSGNDLGATATHMYFAPGAYQVSLYVIDNAGLNSSMMQTITIP